MRIEEENEFKDFISFLDDNGQKRDIWVKLLDSNLNGPFITFKTFDGNTISIPVNRVFKIKRRRDKNGSP